MPRQIPKGLRILGPVVRYRHLVGFPDDLPLIQFFPTLENIGAEVPVQCLWLCGRSPKKKKITWK